MPAIADDPNGLINACETGPRVATGVRARNFPLAQVLAQGLRLGVVVVVFVALRLYLRVGTTGSNTTCVCFAVVSSPVIA